VALVLEMFEFFLPHQYFDTTSRINKYIAIKKVRVYGITINSLMAMQTSNFLQYKPMCARQD
jgi:hypothetical protein